MNIVVYTEDECYGGFVELNCGALRINVIKERYGRHPDEKCFPTPGDCNIEVWFLLYFIFIALVFQK